MLLGQDGADEAHLGGAIGEDIRSSLRSSASIGAVLADVHDESQVSNRRYLSEASMAKINPTSHTEFIAALPTSE